MAKKKDEQKKVPAKQDVEVSGVAGQVAAPNPGDAVLEVGEEVKPTTVADVVTPDGVLEKGPYLDDTIGSF